MGLDRTQRLFIALPVPDAVRNSLLEQRRHWQRRFDYARWTHPEDWHVTLHFIGGTDPSLIPAIVRAMEGAAADVPPFPMALGGFGTFGPAGRPAVLHIVPAEPVEPLRALHAALGPALAEAIGFTPDARPYRPHLTLARKYAGQQPWDKALLAEAPPAVSWTADEICLYRSRLGRSPMYEVIHRTRLRR